MLDEPPQSTSIMADQQHEIPLEPELPQPPPLDQAIANFINARFESLNQELEASINAAFKPLQDMVLSGLTHQAPRPPTLKVNPPPNFDGSRDRGESFMRACTLYMQLNQASFPDDATAIGWILMYMAEGRAAGFRDEVLDEVSKHPEGKYRWETLEEFQKEFNREFTPVAEREEAMVKLEGESYFQKPNESVGDYIDSFKALVRRAGISDLATIVLKFRRGLARNLSLTVATSGAPLGPEDIEGWYDRVRELERARTLDRTITGARSVSNPVRTNFLTTFKRESAPPPRPALPPAPAKQHTYSILSRAPPPAAPIAPADRMEVDASRNRLRAPPVPNDVCRRCGMPGHWQRDCPRRFDIRSATVDELEEALARAKDTAEIEEQQEQAEEAQEAQEGFGTTSG